MVSVLNDYQLMKTIVSTLLQRWDGSTNRQDRLSKLNELQSKFSF